jgi:hypothetical protein
MFVFTLTLLVIYNHFKAPVTKMMFGEVPLTPVTMFGEVPSADWTPTVPDL